MTDDAGKLADEGTRAFRNGEYDRAADLFRRASEAYTAGRAGLMAAEMQNNLSVALLQAGDSRGALEAVLGTDQIFAGANDLKRQGMALGNQAAALESLKRYDEALTAYDQAAELLARVQDGELLSFVKKSSAMLRLRRGDVSNSAMNMIGSIEAKPKPSLIERIFKALIRLKPW